MPVSTLLLEFAKLFQTLMQQLHLLGRRGVEERDGYGRSLRTYFCG
jgi:hypothetical protein